MKTIVRCGAVFAGEAGTARHGMAVLIRDGLIEDLVPDDPSLMSGADYRVVDATRFVAIPGLIDAHVHLTFDVDSQVLLAETDPAAHALRASASATLALRAGLTTVRDCGSPGTSVLALRRAVREGWLPGPDVVVSGPPIAPTGGHMAGFAIRADGKDEIRRAIRQLAGMGADFVKVAVTGGGGTAGTNIFASLYSEGELVSLCDEAHRLGLRVAAHVHGTDGIRSCLAAGVDAIEHCSWLSADGIAFDEALARGIQSRSACVGVTIGAIHRRPMTSHRPELRQTWTAFRREYPLLIHRMSELGVQLSIGTDAGVWQTPIDRYSQALEDLVVKGGFKPIEVLRMATASSARAIGRPDRGVLAPGKRADLVLVEGDPAADIRALERVRLTMVAGRILFDGRGTKTEEAGMPDHM